MAGTYPSAASIYPYGFKSSLVSRGMPLVQTQPGRVFWVNNAATLVNGGAGFLAASDGNPGTFYQPFATIAKGISACAASRGDMVMVGPGHAETIANATTLAINKAGVAIIGLGVGPSRPTLTLSTAATANIPVTVAGCSIQNILFKANFADIVSVFTATGTTTPTDFAIENCEFRDTTSVLNFLEIFTGNATANSMDGFRFVGNRISSLCTTAGRGAIVVGADMFRLTVTDNYGVYAVLNDTSCFIQAGTSQITALDVGRNVVSCPNTSSTGGSFVSGSGNAWTGSFYDNYWGQVDNTAGIWIATGHGSALYYFNNFSMVTGAVDKSALINPVAV